MIKIERGKMKAFLGLDRFEKLVNSISGAFNWVVGPPLLPLSSSSAWQDEKLAGKDLLKQLKIVYG